MNFTNYLKTSHCILMTLCVFLLTFPVLNISSNYEIENSKQQRTSQGIIKTVDKKQYNCLVSTLYYESRGENPKGIKYVLSVIENRKNSEKFPDDYCSIVLQHKQFSFVQERKSKGLSLQAKPVQEGDKKKLDFISKLAHNAVVGKFKSLLPSNVLHYTKTSVRNYWTKKQKVYTVEGNHKFYVSND